MKWKSKPIFTKSKKVQIVVGEEGGGQVEFKLSLVCTSIVFPTFSGDVWWVGGGGGDILNNSIFSHFHLLFLVKNSP